VARRDQYVPKDTVAVELEASVDCTHALEPRSAYAPRPATTLAQLRDVREEVLNARVVSVQD
jgi:hypothetical protein